MKHLKLWKHPDSYLGTTWYEYYVVIGQHRDSDALTRSNFQVAKSELETIEAKHLAAWELDEPMLVNPYENHWAVGHVEWLGVHKDAPTELIEAADTIVGRIENYPILDEEHYSDLQYREANEYWDSLPIWVRLRDYIQPAGLPCFAARHDIGTIMHAYDADRLWESLTSN